MLKNSRFLIMIAVSTLIVIVVGASYAFFTSGRVSSNETSFNVSAEDGLSYFSALFSESEVSFPIRLSDMIKGNYGFENKNSKIDLNVELLSVNNNTTTSCDFDIVYTWINKNTYDTVNDYYYRKSLTLSNDEKEFTYEISDADKKEETQFSDASSLTSEVLMTSNITSSSSNVSTKSHYQIDIKFHNIGDKDQSEQKEKTFSGVLSIENIKCSYSKNNFIPDEYQQVEYIESTGTQYIDTEYIPTLTTYIKTQNMFTNLYPSTQYIYGSSNSYYYWEGYAVLTYGGEPNFWFDYSSYDRSVAGRVLINTIYDIEYYKGAGLINDTQKLKQLDSSYDYKYNLYLFANNSAGSAIYLAKMRLYSAQIYDDYNGNLVRDFVPCYRKNDNVVGLYDKVNKKFYYNLSGDNFNKGPNV